MTEILKVSTKSNPNLVAGALVNILKEKENVEIHSIGAGALNQAVKAVAVARGFVAPSGKEIAVIPSFWEVTIEGQTKTAIKLVVKYM